MREKALTPITLTQNCRTFPVYDERGEPLVAGAFVPGRILEFEFCGDHFKGRMLPNRRERRKLKSEARKK